ncbi:hypothetical protein [Streptomyces luteogriseus]|uniref:Uncharacterized protein n=1 Tax=Streptomyces luteogriseus TaxID=68233 RepID=A0A7W7DG15_9ACTN|nr:hypothetical protein [Streptomyces luteogriseus]MBB4710169.1 hypothetical protein [Streptomyces luteogriseus]
MTDAAGSPNERQQNDNRSRRRLMRGSRADWLSVFVAILALVVSLLSYQQSRKAQSAAQESERQGGAKRVGFWQQNYTNPQVLNVFNRNSFDIDEATITFSDGYYIKVGLVPACHGWTLAGFSTAQKGGGTYTLPFPARLDFRDQDSPPGKWTIDEKPPHRQETPPALPTHMDATEAYRTNVRGPYYVGCAT